MTAPNERPPAAGQTDLVELLKYAQVGRRVTSVTHDVNNFLGAILAYSELIMKVSDLNDEAKRMTGEIVEAVRRSSVLLGTLTSLARKERPNATLCDIEGLVERVVDLCRHDMKVMRIDVRVAAEGNAGSIIVDEPKLIRALVHVIMNALEQLETLKSKRLEITVCALEDGVEVALHNSGDPIPESEREAIFQPSYTTKGNHHTGLGLTVARQVLALHGGSLTYDAQRGFVLRLPRDTQLSA